MKMITKKIQDLLVFDILEEGVEGNYIFEDNDCNKEDGRAIHIDLHDVNNIELCIKSKSNELNDIVCNLFRNNLHKLSINNCNQSDFAKIIDSNEYSCVLSGSNQKRISYMPVIFVDWLGVNDFIFIPEPEYVGVISVSHDLKKAGAFIVTNKLCRVYLV